jgi:hypothetical protein
MRRSVDDSSLRLDYRPDLGPRDAPPPGGGAPTPTLTRRVIGLGLRLVVLAAILLLPFIVLVRLAVHAYAGFGVGNWTALWLAGAGVSLLLFFYALVLRFRFQRKLGVPRGARWLVVVSVGAFVAYTLLYLSGGNAKTPEIREAYTELSPLLRLSTGTVLLVDREAMVTDVDRTAADYLAWGRSVNEASLHFVQDDGFVHAVDLRTLGRPAWRNWALEQYYRSMGFRTLRHDGTADHLHVAMPRR